jgi:hypothetical protein
MSDYRNPDDPMWRNASYDPQARIETAAWGWIAAAVFLVVVLAVAFGVQHEPSQRTAATTPPVANGLAPPPASAPSTGPMAPLIAPTSVPRATPRP